MALHSIRKIQTDADQWFLSHALDKIDKENEIKNGQLKNKTWSPPPPTYVNCNIGSTWDKSSKVSGASWVLCDS